MIYDVGAQFIAPNSAITRTDVGAQFIAPTPRSTCRYNYHIIIPIEVGAIHCAPTF